MDASDIQVQSDRGRVAALPSRERYMHVITNQETYFGCSSSVLLKVPIPLDPYVLYSLQWYHCHLYQEYSSVPAS